MSSIQSTTDPLVLDLQYHDIDGIWTQTIDARKLHDGLEVPTRFEMWIARRIKEYEFLEGSDFFTHLCRTAGRPQTTYVLTLDMAKELCMVERSPKGRQARQYFIACEKAAMNMSGAVTKMLEQFDERLRALEGAQHPVKRPDQLTAKGQLPPLAPRIKEHAEISPHLVAVWRIVQQAKTPLDNREIAQQAGIGLRTTSAHTRYLFQLDLLELFEVFPRHLYRMRADAAQRRPQYWQRLEEITAIMDTRRGFSFEDLERMRLPLTR